MAELRSPIDVLIVGAGMHVCGRGTSTCGTVLPAVLQARRDGMVERMRVAATSAGSIKAFQEKLDILTGRLGTTARFEAFPASGTNRFAWREALEGLSERSCVIVVVPDALHAEVAGAALARRIPVLVEKPLTATLAEGRRLVALARDRKTYGAVDFHKRWDLVNLKLKEAVEQRRLGTPLYATIEYSQRRVIPEKIFRSWVEQANPFQYLCVHFVDILHFALGAMPLRAMANGQKQLLAAQGIDAYDAVQAVVEWALPAASTRFVSTFAANWVDPNTTSALSYQSLKVIGTLGRFESDQKDRGLRVITDENGIEDVNPYFTQSYPIGSVYTYRGYGIDSVRTFLEDVRDLADGLCTLEDLERCRPTLSQALVSTAVVEAVNRSLHDGGNWVPIEPV